MLILVWRGVLVSIPMTSNHDVIELPLPPNGEGKLTKSSSMVCYHLRSARVIPASTTPNRYYRVG